MCSRLCLLPHPVGLISHFRSLTLFFNCWRTLRYAASSSSVLIVFPCPSRHLLTNGANPSRANPRSRREMPRSCKHEVGLGNATTSSRIIYKWLFCPARSVHSCAAFSLHVCPAVKCCFREGSRAAFKTLSKSLRTPFLPLSSAQFRFAFLQHWLKVIRRIIFVVKIKNTATCWNSKKNAFGFLCHVRHD